MAGTTSFPASTELHAPFKFGTNTGTLDSKARKEPPSLFNKPAADTVLRSADGVDFRVKRAILTEASPFFEDMFSLPQPPPPPPGASETTAEGAEGQERGQEHHACSEPIIPMTEDSRVLHLLLRLCYPIPDQIPLWMTLVDVRGVLDAAIKYDVPVALQTMRRSLLALAPSYPLRVFALACIFGFAHEARQAAQQYFSGSAPTSFGASAKNALLLDRKSTRLNSSHSGESRMPSSA